MRITLAAAALALAVGGPAFAQSGQSQTPVAPNAGNAAPQSSNSLPPGSESQQGPANATGSTPSAYPTLNSGTSTTTVTPSR